MKPTHVHSDSPGPRRPSPAPQEALDLDQEALAVLHVACHLQDRQRSRLSRRSGVTRFRRWGGA